jgi:hypothetical protein
VLCPRKRLRLHLDAEDGLDDRLCARARCYNRAYNDAANVGGSLITAFSEIFRFRYCVASIIRQQGFSFSDSMTIRPQWIFVLL